MRELDPLVSAAPVLQAGPAHIATLKTFDPPLRELEGRRFAGAGRRGKWLLFPTADKALQLRVHLMSAGRIRHLASGAKGPKTPAFRLRFENGGELVLTEAGSKKRAGVWLESPEQTRGRARASRSGGARARRREAARDPRGRQPAAALAPARPARDRRDRAGARERDPPSRAAVAVRALRQPRRGRDRAARGGDRGRPDACARAAARRQGRQGRLPRPPQARRAVPAVRRPAAAGRLRGAHRLLLRALPDRRQGAEGPPHVAAEVARACSSRHSATLGLARSCRRRSPVRAVRTSRQ